MTVVVLTVAQVGAAVLVWAGVTKVRRPGATGDALRLAGLPGRALAARMIGVGEVALGGAVLLGGGALPLGLLAGAYAAFAAFAAWQRRRPGASCGCFGDAGAPVGRVHVVVDVAFAAAAGAAAPGPAVGVPAAVGEEPLLTAIAAVLLAVAAVLVGLLLAAAPRLAAETDRAGAGTRHAPSIAARARAVVTSTAGEGAPA